MLLGTAEGIVTSPSAQSSTPSTGVAESVIRAAGGWKTAAMFRRCAIVSSADQWDDYGPARGPKGTETRVPENPISPPIAPEFPNTGISGQEQKSPLWRGDFTYKSFRIRGAGRGGRTPMTLRSADFESAASASSAIPAQRNDEAGKPPLDERLLRLSAARSPRRKPTSCFVGVSHRPRLGINRSRSARVPHLLA